jgi:hypothetical protein
MDFDCNMLSASNRCSWDVKYPAFRSFHLTQTKFTSSLAAEVLCPEKRVPPNIVRFYLKSQFTFNRGIYA